mgnify:CR=1 FL=1
MECGNSRDAPETLICSVSVLSVSLWFASATAEVQIGKWA